MVGVGLILTDATIKEDPWTAASMTLLGATDERRVGKDLRDLGQPRMLAFEMRQRRDNGLRAIVLREQPFAQEFEFVSRRDRPVAVLPPCPADVPYARKLRPNGGA